MTTEAEYLKSYQAQTFPSPLVTVDSVLFTLLEQQLCVLLVKRGNHPQQGFWGLPGGFIDQQADESTYDTAMRKLLEKTSVEPGWLEQLATFSGKHRDPRGWSLTTAYFALIAHQNCQPQITDVQNAKWFPLKTLNTMSDIAFDHRQIIQAAQERLEQKTLYSMIPVYCLPAEFTLSALQSVMEAILDKPVLRKSLIRRVEASDMLEETGATVATGARHAKLYRIKPGADIHLFSRNMGA